MSQSDKSQLMEKYWLSYLMWARENNKTDKESFEEESFWVWYTENILEKNS